MTDRPEAEGALIHRLIDGSPVVTVVVDDQGVFTYTSENVQRLFGYTADEIVGTNILDYLDPDFSAESMDSIGAALVRSGLQRPMVFRLNHRDGTQPIVEVTANSQLDDPLVDGLMAYIRPWEERWWLDQVLEAIAGSASLEETLQLLVRVMGAEILEADGVVIFDVAEGSLVRSVTAEGLGSAQSGTDVIPASPWELALTTGEPVRQRVDELVEPLRAEAIERGHHWCWAWPVPGRNAPQACLVLWRRLDEDVDHTCRVSIERLVRLTELVMGRERSASDLRWAASHDALTGLANRSRFLTELRTAVEGGSDRGDQVGVLYLDLDGFKPVNDAHGHSAGDEVLRVVSQRLSRAVRGGDLVARLGGDEFTVLCPGVRDAASLSMLAERLVAAVAEPIDIGDGTVHVSATIGIALAPSSERSVEELVEAADSALYAAKREARGTWRLADPG